MHPPACRAVGTGAGVSGKGGAPLVKALAGLGWTSGGRSGQEAGDRVRWSAVLCRMAWLPVAQARSGVWLWHHDRAPG